MQEKYHKNIMKDLHYNSTTLSIIKGSWPMSFIGVGLAFYYGRICATDIKINQSWKMSDYKR